MNIPSAHLFWSVVEAPGIQGGPLPEGLWPAVEDDLPVSSELVWAIGTPIEGGRLLVCAALRSELGTFTSTDDVLIPSEVPSSLSVGDVDSKLLNLLVGSFEPIAIRKRRRHRRLVIATIALGAAILVGIGLERRTAKWDQETSDQDAAIRSVIASISPSLGWGVDDMALELAERRQAKPVEPQLSEDAAVAMAALIARWPVHIPTRPQSITASGTGASVTVLVPAESDAAGFVSAFKPPEGWQLEEPRLVSVEKATRINLELRKATP